MPPQTITARLLLILFLTLTHPLSATDTANKYENQLLTVINQYRISRHLSPLKTDETLNTLAREHSLYMEKKESLSHKHFKKRFKKSHFELCVENVGYSTVQTPEGQLKSWQQSPKHNTNLLNPSLRCAGIGKAGSYVCFIGGSRRKNQ